MPTPSIVVPQTSVRRRTGEEKKAVPSCRRAARRHPWQGPDRQQQTVSRYDSEPAMGRGAGGRPVAELGAVAFLLDELPHLVPGDRCRPGPARQGGGGVLPEGLLSRATLGRSLAIVAPIATGTQWDQIRALHLSGF